MKVEEPACMTYLADLRVSFDEKWGDPIMHPIGATPRRDQVGGMQWNEQLPFWDRLLLLCDRIRIHR